MSMDGLGTKCRRNVAENISRLGRAQERYRRQTSDDRQTDRRTGDSIAKVPRSLKMKEQTKYA